jgi:hypothetical protein
MSSRGTVFRLQAVRRLDDGYVFDCSATCPSLDLAIRATTALALVRGEWAMTQNAFSRTGSSRRDSENSEPRPAEIRQN